MIDRDNVIKGLECHKRAMYGDIDEHGFACNLCPYKDMEDACRPRTEGKLIADALALLKAQEPRVMTIQDIRKYDKDTMWFETRFDGNLIQLTKDGIVALSFVAELHKWNEHGKSWRCWTARPTDEQRKAVKWE